MGIFSASLVFKLPHQNESLKMWQVHGGPDDLSNIVLFKNYQISLKGFHNFHRKKGRNILTGFHYFVKLNHPPISHAFNIFRVDSPDGWYQGICHMCETFPPAELPSPPAKR